MYSSYFGKNIKERMMKMKKTCYVTTPIYYASANVHIGNSYSTVVCDCFARYNRLKGNDTFYLTGMDEHGLKIEEAAKKQGITPQELVDKVALSTSNLWENLKITNDDFIRTSEARHSKAVQEIFETMLKNGDIYLGSYEGDYCVSCEAYFTKTQLGEGGTCPDCGKPTRKVKEESYFLNLKKYSDKLLQYIEDHPDFIQPESRKNEVVSFIKSGLEDLCVSRTSFSWGIQVPSNPKHVIYVWIDALSNYITALGYNSKDDAKYQKYWVNGDEVVHVIGKDILRFHAIYWPIMLMALNVPIKFKLYVHGWYLMKDGKMSKSRGNMVYPMDVVNRYGLDATRYYLISQMPLGNDALFSYDLFIEKFNTDLANSLGNLVSRTIAMINKYFNGVVKKPNKDYFTFDSDLLNLTNETIEKYHESFSSFRFQTGINAIFDLVSRANKYIDETEPWVLAKDPSLSDKLNDVMYHLYEVIRNVAIMVNPVMPDASNLILSYLNAKLDFSELGYGKNSDAKVIEKCDAIFKRLDLEKELEYQKKVLEEKQTKKETFKEEITIDEFSKLDLRVGEVLECKKLEKSDKLLVLKVKIGEDVRQIVSGISKFYEPNQMVGKHVIVVCNLKPANLRGEISQGMILAASNENELEVLTSKLENNSKVS